MADPELDWIELDVTTTVQTNAGDPSDFVVTLEAEISLAEGKAKKIGHMRTHLVKLANATNEGVSWFSVLDSSIRMSRLTRRCLKATAQNTQSGFKPS